MTTILFFCYFLVKKIVNNMIEIWRDIVGYEGLYQVSNLGRVKALGNGNARNPNWQKERILKAEKDINGYLRVSLSKEGNKKHYRVHRLVATAFIPNPDSLPQINHISEDKTNNVCSNLEWCSAKYNSNFGTRIQRVVEKNSKQILCIETNKIYQSATQIERELGYPHQSISKVCTGKRNTYKGLHFKFV